MHSVQTVNTQTYGREADWRKKFFLPGGSPDVFRHEITPVRPSDGLSENEATLVGKWERGSRKLLEKTCLQLNRAALHRQTVSPEARLTQLAI